MLHRIAQCTGAAFCTAVACTNHAIGCTEQQRWKLTSNSFADQLFYCNAFYPLATLGSFTCPARQWWYHWPHHMGSVIIYHQPHTHTISSLWTPVSLSAMLINFFCLSGRFLLLLQSCPQHLYFQIPGQSGKSPTICKSPGLWYASCLSFNCVVVYFQNVCIFVEIR